MPPKGSKTAPKDTPAEGPSKKQKTGDKATKDAEQGTGHKDIISADKALPVNHMQLYTGGQSILLGCRVPKVSRYGELSGLTTELVS